jgi:hypothetical protein
MRWTHAILVGAMLLGAVAPCWGQYRYRPYRYSSRYYYPPQSMRQPNYLPPGGYGVNPPSDAFYRMPQQQTDGRGLWVYGSQGEGSFQQLPDGSWVESNSTGQYHFLETARTPTHIDLFDPNRNAFARLTDRVMYHHGLGDPSWHQGYIGQWE